MEKNTGAYRKQSVRADKIFKLAATIAGSFVLVIIALMIFQLISESYPIWEVEGLSFIIGTDWNAVEGRESFGALPYIAGTLVTAALAMVIGVPLSIGIAMFISDAPAKIGGPLGFLVELLAAVPSIIYGLWGLLVFRLYFQDWVEKPLHDLFGDSIFLFSGTPFGLDIITASVILAIMIIPTVSSVSREIMKAVPQQQREAAYMLGATKWEMFKLAVFPYSKTGLIGASILGLGRAVGETMAVTMLIGNATGIAAFPSSFFKPSQTMSSIIANEFVEASPASLHLPALIGVALILLLIAIVINVVAHLLVTRMMKVKEGAINN
ncbi:MAG: phosphate ABC transporter permease subunit PstC [Crenarchaeota archaeon]|nr:phosphate ABC transporter permease subunit PstC [Thermoproteota archaeon]MDA0854184.1 phosphate ABC transporter permease subunit PstC [Thermoproteota archaeon]MDA1122802.1 phosphate ABC transporter permease subunit PstC [Thermoproteota archaeon]HJJ24936.1 phosphate ABC transporter permease subunit PstC [Nitrosopumilus sp.]HJJ26261.1 phosphate ABC transporter permease subunit PstC [Nitrosopumilus sp.]